MEEIQVKMAKASKDDIDRCRKFFQFVEEFMDYGTHTPENDESEEDSIDLTDEAFVEKLREMWGRRFGHHGVDVSWNRVVLGCDILIDNVCDPNADTLEWKPEYAEKLAAEASDSVVIDQPLVTSSDAIDKAIQRCFKFRGMIISERKRVEKDADVVTWNALDGFVEEAKAISDLLSKAAHE